MGQRQERDLNEGDGPGRPSGAGTPAKATRKGRKEAMKPSPKAGSEAEGVDSATNTPRPPTRAKAGRMEEAVEGIMVVDAGTEAPAPSTRQKKKKKKQPTPARFAAGDTMAAEPAVVAPQAPSARSAKKKKQAARAVQTARVEGSKSKKPLSNPWFDTAVTTIAGGSLGKCPPVFSKDSTMVMCAVSSHINVFNCATGQLVTTLSSTQPNAHSDDITGLCLSTQNWMRVYSASKDGTVRLWDVNDGTLLGRWDFNEPIIHLQLHPTEPTSIYVHLRREGMKDRLTYAKLRSRAIPAQKRVVTKPDIIAVLTTATILIVVCRTEVILFSLPDHIQLRVIPTNPLTCAAVHPTDPVLALGHETGIIHLIHCLANPADPNPPISRWHWHASAVGCIGFTPDGVYMISGGAEGVLVHWQLATGDKRFLPKLQSAITGCSVSGDESLIGCVSSDNTIRVVGTAALDVLNCVVGLRVSARALDRRGGMLQPGLEVDARTGAVVLSGTPGAVQMYDVWADRHMVEIVCVPGTIVLGAEAAAGEPVVMKIAVEESGEWLATVDGRWEGDEVDRVGVKVWRRLESGLFEVNTRVDGIHEEGVSSLRFSTRSGVAAASASPLAMITTSVDGSFRVWQLQRPRDDLQSSGEAEPFWTPRFVGSDRGAPLRDSAYSPDGSVFAIGSDTRVTLWDATTCQVTKVLAQLAPSGDELVRVAFAGRSGEFLVTMTAGGLVRCWNLLTCSVWWACSISSGRAGECWLAVDTHADRFAVAVVDEKDADDDDAVSSSRVVVWSVSSPKPTGGYRVRGAVRGLTFAREDKEGSRLLCLTGLCEIVALGGWDDGRAAIDRELAGVTEVQETRGMLTDMYGVGVLESRPEEVVSARRERDPEMVAREAEAAVAHARGDDGLAFMRAPSHQLPAAEVMAESFFKVFMTKYRGVGGNAATKKAVEEEEAVLEKEQEDEEPTDVVRLTAADDENGDDLVGVLQNGDDDVAEWDVGFLEDAFKEMVLSGPSNAIKPVEKATPARAEAPKPVAAMSATKPPAAASKPLALTPLVNGNAKSAKKTKKPADPEKMEEDEMEMPPAKKSKGVPAGEGKSKKKEAK
ncbi:WD repeat-containing protein 75 [Irineochytrium annulatum]|nr:WD repeat-containing protein 75 [Irineochytrium annulatum]